MARTVATSCSTTPGVPYNPGSTPATGPKDATYRKWSRRIPRAGRLSYLARREIGGHPPAPPFDAQEDAADDRGRPDQLRPAEGIAECERPDQRTHQRLQVDERAGDLRRHARLSVRVE